MTPSPPRYSSRPLPRAAFIPGVSPRTDRPADTAERPTAVDCDQLAADETFRHGLDLFNHGFPWEAHEAWEPLWFAAPPDRSERALLQGLIHAAAAVIKARAGAAGVARSFVESACSYLALVPAAAPGGVPGAVIDTAALIAALTAWADDPAQPPPWVTLRAG